MLLACWEVDIHLVDVVMHPIGGIWVIYWVGYIPSVIEGRFGIGAVLSCCSVPPGVISAGEEVVLSCCSFPDVCRICLWWMVSCIPQVGTCNI